MENFDIQVVLKTMDSAKIRRFSDALEAFMNAQEAIIFDHILATIEQLRDSDQPCTWETVIAAVKDTRK